MICEISIHFPNAHTFLLFHDFKTICFKCKNHILALRDLSQLKLLDLEKLQLGSYVKYGLVLEEEISSNELKKLILGYKNYLEKILNLAIFVPKAKNG